LLLKCNSHRLFFATRGNRCSDFSRHSRSRYSQPRWRPLSAHAKEKAKNAVAANAVAVECFKQFGFSYDATTKKWTLFTADDSIGKMDAVKACISRGTGIPVTQIPLREQRVDY